MSDRFKSDRITVLEKEDYKVELEFNEDFAIFHLPSVTKFTKTTYLDFVRSLEDFKKFLKVQGYEYVWVALPPDDVLLKKFTSKLGFAFIGNNLGYDIYNMRTN